MPSVQLNKGVIQDTKTLYPSLKQTNINHCQDLRVSFGMMLDLARPDAHATSQCL